MTMCLFFELALGFENPSYVKSRVHSLSLCPLFSVSASVHNVRVGMLCGLYRLNTKCYCLGAETPRITVRRYHSIHRKPTEIQASPCTTKSTTMLDVIGELLKQHASSSMVTTMNYAGPRCHRCLTRRRRFPLPRREGGRTKREEHQKRESVSVFASARSLEMAKLLHKRGYKLTTDLSKMSRPFVPAPSRAFLLYVENTCSQTSSM